MTDRELIDRMKKNLESMADLKESDLLSNEELTDFGFECFENRKRIIALMEAGEERDLLNSNISALQAQITAQKELDAEAFESERRAHEKTGELCKELEKENSQYRDKLTEKSSKMWAKYVTENKELIKERDSLRSQVDAAGEDVERLQGERDRYRAALEWLRENAEDLVKHSADGIGKNSIRWFCDEILDGRSLKQLQEPDGEALEGKG